MVRPRENSGQRQKRREAGREDADSCPRVYQEFLSIVRVIDEEQAARFGARRKCRTYPLVGSFPG